MIISKKMTDAMGVEHGKSFVNVDIVVLAPLADILHRDEDIAQVFVIV
jgi:hypothetical protein